LATERAYVIRVSSVLDRSTSAAVGDLVQQYDRAGRASSRRLNETQRLAERVARDQERSERQATTRAEREAERRSRAETREKERSVGIAQRLIDRAYRDEQKAAERSQSYVARIKDRYFRDQQRQEEQAERRADRRAEVEQRRAESERRSRVKAIASDAMQTAGAIGRKALGVAGEIAGGFGVDFSIGRGVSKAVQLEQMAIAITNAGNRGTGGAAGAADRAAQPAQLEAMARSVGQKYAFDPTQVLGGLAQYQALTGDLDTAKAGMDGLAALAKGFNVDLDKMVAAAGQVGSAIGEIGEGKEFKSAEEKAAAVNDVLRTMTAQGQEGAIEIANLATQMSALKAAGGRFEGSTAESIKRMGALAQLSMQLGGSKSASQASTAVMGFANTLATPARRAQFKAMGVDIDSATQKGAFADPFEIIRRSLLKTGGATEPMKKLFANVIGERAVLALSTSFNKAGGGEKGIAAVNAQFSRFGGTITDAQIKENLGRAMGSKGAQAQQLQNDVDAAWADMTQQLIPAMRDLAPVAKQVTQGFAGVVSWAANNPGVAITAAIVGSIAKASLGAAVGEGLKKMLGGAGAAGGGGAGALGTAGVIATLSIATATIGMAAIDKFFTGKEDAQKGTMEGDLQIDEAKTILKGASKTGQISVEDKKKLEEDIAHLRERISLAKGEQGQVIGGSVGAMLRAGENYVTGGPSYARMVQAQGDAGKLPKLQKDLAGLQEKYSSLTSGGLKIAGTVNVNIVGGMPGGAAGADGRTGVPDTH